MTENKKTVERYMDGFNKWDHEQILSCLTDDVVWDMPGQYHWEGKAAFTKEITNEMFVGKPIVTTTRMIEENDIVIAEGTAQAMRKEGGVLYVMFSDVFEMRGGKIKRLISYIMEVKSFDISKWGVK